MSVPSLFVIVAAFGCCCAGGLAPLRYCLPAEVRRWRVDVSMLHDLFLCVRARRASPRPVGTILAAQRYPLASGVRGRLGAPAASSNAASACCLPAAA